LSLAASKLIFTKAANLHQEESNQSESKDSAYQTTFILPTQVGGKRGSRQAGRPEPGSPPGRISEDTPLVVKIHINASAITATSVNWFWF